MKNKVKELQRINKNIIDQNGHLLSFDKQLIQLMSGVFDTRFPLVINETTHSLDYINQIDSEKPLLINSSTVIKLRDKHDLGYEFVSEIENKLKNSVLAFDSLTQNTSKIILLNEFDEDTGDPMIAICRYDKDMDEGTTIVNEITSVYDLPVKCMYISNGKAAGGRPLDMYMQFTGKSYTEAIQDLQSYVDPNKEIVIPVERPEKKQMTEKERQDNLLKQLKENRDKSVKNKEMKNAFAYLTKTRGIDSEIVSKFAKEKLLFQTSDDLGRTQVAFVGKNENGYISAISFRATNPKVKFMGDYSGCDYTRGWFYDPSCDIGQRLFDKSIAPDPAKTLLCFESSIEMMSYMSILKNSGINYHDYVYLSCGSIHKNDAILKTCEAYGFEKAVIMFNNDFVQEQSEGRNPGKEAAIATAEMLNKKGIKASVRIPDKVNDWNDYLRDMQKAKVSDLVKKTPIAAHSL